MTGLALYHFTCQHAYERLGDECELLPPALQDPERSWHWLPTAQFVWFTDLAHPTPSTLGLTRHMLECDRAAYRYKVTTRRDIVRWSQVRGAVPRIWVEGLESEDGARPAHWWVAWVGVPAVLDRVMGRPPAAFVKASRFTAATAPDSRQAPR